MFEVVEGDAGSWSLRVTVSELISELEKLPQELRIVVQDGRDPSDYVIATRVGVSTEVYVPCENDGIFAVIT